MVGKDCMVQRLHGPHSSSHHPNCAILGTDPAKGIQVKSVQNIPINVKLKQHLYTHIHSSITSKG